MASGNDDKEFLLPSEVAQRLYVSPKTVARWATMGLIPCVVTLGGHRRFRREDVEAIAKRMAEERVPVPVEVSDEPSSVH